METTASKCSNGCDGIENMQFAMVAFLPLSGKADVARHEDIVDTKVKVIAGNVGSEQYMSYTLIGDTVNIAARLSQRARAGEVLFSNALKLSLDNDVDSTIPMLALPPLTLRGRSNPIDIFCVPIEKRINLRH